MKKYLLAIVLFLSTTASYAEIDLITFLTSQEPVASWTAAQKLSVLNDLAERYNYKTTIVNEQGETVPNPETKKQFVNRQLLKIIARFINQVRIRRAQASVVVEEISFE